MQIVGKELTVQYVIEKLVDIINNIQTEEFVKYGEAHEIDDVDELNESLKFIEAHAQVNTTESLEAIGDDIEEESEEDVQQD